MKEERGTLKTFSSHLTEEEMKRRDTLLITMHHLSMIQSNFAKEISWLLNKDSLYRHEVKHNHHEIMKLISKNVKNIFRDKDYDLMDSYQKTGDKIEKAICDIMGIDVQFNENE